MTGRFCMVCRDSVSHKARPVNPLLISTPEDEALMQIGEGVCRQRIIVHCSTGSDELPLHLFYSAQGSPRDAHAARTLTRAALVRRGRRATHTIPAVDGRERGARTRTCACR